MKKALFSWSRLFLWSHVVGVIGFYSILWLRTRPAKPQQAPARELPKATDTHSGEAVQDLPSVSIIVPARNEERNIRRCVISLLEQDYPRYEVIVVDDESADATPAILDELA
ncbi:MAG TPA: glycosyltransferase family 2 protein, partial [Ktedonobacteraceae bacterium]|nr:glycosyltransferase family 2 protein [Ktedonobacteraceae bacterium]